MDWNTLVASLVGSGAVVGGIGYLLKLATERALDVRLDKLRQENQAQIQEQFRREAFIWDKQFEATKSLLSLVYRFRNAFRELATLGDGASGEDRKTRNEIVRRLNIYARAVSEILYEERAVLPPELFKAAHELQTPVVELELLTKRYFSKKVSPASENDQSALPRELKSLYARIDAVYSVVVNLSHVVLGVAENEKARTTPNSGFPADA